MEIAQLKATFSLTKKIIQKFQEISNDAENDSGDIRISNMNEITVAINSLKKEINLMKKTSTSIIDFFRSENLDLQNEIQRLQNEVIMLTNSNDIMKDEFYHKIRMVEEDRKSMVLSESKMKDQLHRASTIIEYQREEFEKLRKKVLVHDSSCIEPLLTAIWQMTSHEEIITEVVSVTDSFIHVIFGILKDCADASSLESNNYPKLSDRLAASIGIFVNLTACNAGLDAIYSCQTEGLHIMELIVSLIINSELLTNKYLRRLVLDILNNLSNSKEKIVVQLIDSGAVSYLCDYFLKEKDLELKQYSLHTIRSMIKFGSSSFEPIKQVLHDFLIQLKHQKVELTELKDLEMEILALK